MWTLLFVFGQGTRAAGDAPDWDTALLILMGAALIGFVLALPGFARCLFLLLRHLPVDGSVRQIALALRDPKDRDRRQELLEEAIVSARRSVDLNSNEVRFLLQLAVSLDRAGYDEESIRWCKRAVEMQPLHGRSHRSLVGMMKKTGNLQGRREERERHRYYAEKSR